MVAPFGERRRSVLDRRADARIGSAPADEAGHRGVDLRLAGFAVGAQQSRRAHHLATLAIATLRHVVLDPRVLHSLADQVGGQAFDGRNVRAFDRCHRHDTRARRRAVHIDRAGAAQRRAAAVLGAGQLQVVTQDPQDRRGGIHVDRYGTAVYVELGHCSAPGLARVLSLGPRRTAHERHANGPACWSGIPRRPVDWRRSVFRNRAKQYRQHGLAGPSVCLRGRAAKHRQSACGPRTSQVATSNGNSTARITAARTGDS